MPKVEPDFHQGVRLAVHHLADLGHTRIGYLSPKSPQTDLRRLREFGAAMEERGLSVDPSLVVFHPESGEDTPLVGYHAASALLERRSPFTALFTYSDILAVGAARREPVIVTKADGDYVAARQRMRLTLSCDHRVIDGAVGAAFLRELADTLENPALGLA